LRFGCARSWVRIPASPEIFFFALFSSLSSLSSLYSPFFLTSLFFCSFLSLSFFSSSLSSFFFLRRSCPHVGARVSVGVFQPYHLSFFLSFPLPVLAWVLARLLERFRVASGSRVNAHVTTPSPSYFVSTFAAYPVFTSHPPSRRFSLLFVFAFVFLLV
jgi:hypothetical protein